MQNKKHNEQVRLNQVRGYETSASLNKISEGSDTEC